MRKFTSLITLMFVAVAALQAQTTDYPFTLTQPGEEPVLYYIYSGRDGNGGKSEYVFESRIPWKETVEEVQISRADPRCPLEQFWYFVEAADGNIKIASALDNKLITVANTNDAAKCTKVISEDEITNEYCTWILNCTNGYYAFQTSDKRTFLSHNGNWSTAGSRMGLYNANGSADEGSRVFFEAAPEGVTSGIVNVTTDKKETIFDLTGRQIEQITVPGIYIINGKKVIR